ncbi:hypothetical protein Q3G72_035033 [Acer saccharum]|nr:hypothetical protein Q3G72_035033 [Acer saccharum]
MFLTRFNQELCQRGLLFSFSADGWHWNEVEKYKFTSELVSKLEDYGRLSQRNFSFADKVDTTKYAKLDVSRLYPELSHWKYFLDKYPDIRDLKMYRDRRKLEEDLRNYRKGIVDCYFARNCLNKFCGCILIKLTRRSRT